jgi:dethiobiotin synthetase
MNYFITGTDTGVGKTYFTALMTRALREAGADVVAMKPICCGDRDDAHALREAAGGVEPIDRVNPVWLRAPAAPLAATLLGEPEVDFERVLAVYRELRARHPSVLVEGVGGWLAPVKATYSMADFAVAMGLPVIIVVANRLGAINHTLLTIESIRARGLRCAGLILNHPVEANEEADPAIRTNRAAIERITAVTVLAEVKKDQAAIALNNFS